MQAAEHRFREDERIHRQAMASLWLRDDFLVLRRIRHTRSERAMRTSAVVMRHPTSENRTKMRFGHRDQPIQALSPCRSDDPLAQRIRLRARNGGSQYFDSQGSDRIVEALGEDPISIVDQVAMPSSIPHDFPQLLQGPAWLCSCRDARRIASCHNISRFTTPPNLTAGTKLESYRASGLVRRP
jgi:hypothetical protein